MENNSANRNQSIISIIDSLLNRFEWDKPPEWIGAEDLLMFNGYLWSVESNEYEPSIKDYIFDITFIQ